MPPMSLSCHARNLLLVAERVHLKVVGLISRRHETAAQTQELIRRPPLLILMPATVPPPVGVTRLHRFYASQSSPLPMLTTPHLLKHPGSLLNSIHDEHCVRGTRRLKKGYSLVISTLVFPRCKRPHSQCLQFDTSKSRKPFVNATTNDRILQGNIQLPSDTLDISRLSRIMKLHVLISSSRQDVTPSILRPATV